MSNDWRVYVFETVSGRVVDELPYVGAPSFSDALNDSSVGGSVTVALSSKNKAQIDQYTQPWRWSIAVVWNGYILQGGPVISESYTDGSATSTINFGGLWKLLTRRVVLNTYASNPAVAAQDVTYTNVTLRQIAKNLVLHNNSNAANFVPLSYPADDPTDTHTATYFGYDANILSDMLINLTGVDQGPEITFRPYFSTPGLQTTIGWKMLVGSPRLGQIGSNWVWDYGSRGALMQLDFARDGSDMSSTSFVRGSGSQYAQIFGVSKNTTLTDAQYPNLDNVDANHTDVTDVGTANAYALANTNTYTYPLNSYSAVIKCDATDQGGKLTGSPTLSDISVGDTAQFTVMDHRRIPDGTYVHRIIAIANNDLMSARLTLQPTYEAS